MKTLGLSDAQKTRRRAYAKPRPKSPKEVTLGWDPIGAPPSSNQPSEHEKAALSKSDKNKTVALSKSDKNNRAETVALSKSDKNKTVALSKSDKNKKQPCSNNMELKTVALLEAKETEKIGRNPDSTSSRDAQNKTVALSKSDKNKTVALSKSDTTRIQLTEKTKKERTVALSKSDKNKTVALSKSDKNNRAETVALSKSDKNKTVALSKSDSSEPTKSDSFSLRRGPQPSRRLDILSAIADNASSGRRTRGRTGVVALSPVCKKLGIKPTTGRTHLARLQKTNLIKICERFPGNRGGYIFQVTELGYKALDGHNRRLPFSESPQRATVLGPQRATVAFPIEEEDLSTSSSKEQKGVTTRLEEMIRGYGFGEEPTLKASGLVHWQNQDHFAGPEHFLGAVAVVLCRWAQNPELPKRLRDLNATLSSELQKPASAQPPPEGFETWQERQERLWVERSKAGADRALERRTERLSAQADAWVQAGPSDEELRALVGSEAFAVLQKTGSRISLMKAARQAKFEQLQGEEVLPAPLSGSEA